MPEAWELIMSPGAYRAEATRLAYPIPDRSQIDSIRHPEAPRQTEVCLRSAPRRRSCGGGSPLEGGKALGLSASLWGEQVITYVDSGSPANQARPPGVSRAIAPPRIPHGRPRGGDAVADRSVSRGTPRSTQPDGCAKAPELHSGASGIGGPKGTPSSVLRSDSSPNHSAV
jgi:hypothetical protein